MESQRAIFGARRTTSATAGFGAGGARDPRNPKTTGRLGGPGGLTNVQPAPPDVWKVSRHGLGAAELLLQPPGLVGSHGTFLQLRNLAPKRRVDRAVLGACQRCSPLTQTYGKSAGMIGGRGDHFCDILFWSVHVTLAPTTNSGARFCG